MEGKSKNANVCFSIALRIAWQEKRPALLMQERPLNRPFQVFYRSDTYAQHRCWLQEGSEKIVVRKSFLPKNKPKRRQVLFDVNGTHGHRFQCAEPIEYSKNCQYSSCTVSDACRVRFVILSQESLMIKTFSSSTTTLAEWSRFIMMKSYFAQPVFQQLQTFLPGHYNVLFQKVCLRFRAERWTEKDNVFFLWFWTSDVLVRCYFCRLLLFSEVSREKSYFVYKGSIYSVCSASTICWDMSKPGIFFEFFLKSSLQFPSSRYHNFFRHQTVNQMAAFHYSEAPIFRN